MRPPRFAAIAFRGVAGLTGTCVVLCILSVACWSWLNPHHVFVIGKEYRNGVVVTDGKTTYHIYPRAELLVLNGYGLKWISPLKTQWDATDTFTFTELNFPLYAYH